MEKQEMIKKIRKVIGPSYVSIKCDKILAILDFSLSGSGSRRGLGRNNLR